MKFSDRDQRRICAAYVAGEPIDDIAKRFGCHRSYPSQLAKRRAHGLRRDPSDRADVPPELAAALADIRVRKKISLCRLARRIGVAHASLRHWEIGRFRPSQFDLDCWRQALGLRQFPTQSHATAEVL